MTIARIDGAGLAGRNFETVIIGAGQAGLAASYCLTEAGHPHIVLERDRVAASWRTGRWDSFTLVTPNWMIRLPGFEPPGLESRGLESRGLESRGLDPDGFIGRDDLVALLEDYAASFDAPVASGVGVRRLSRAGDGFRLDTTSGALFAENVIVCTGYFHEAQLPSCAFRIASEIHQVHSSRYRRPDDLPPGGVLVVGSGQSGCQIAEELLRAGRPTTLSVGAAPREPRRYRGRDINYWFALMGGFDHSLADPENPQERYRPNPHCSGAGGGHALNLEAFALDGMRLVGPLEGAQGTSLRFAPELVANVRRADAASKEMMREIDRFIEVQEIDAPLPTAENSDDGQRGVHPLLSETTGLDLQEEGIETIVWATGFSCDFRWIDFPACDVDGYPIQRRGVSPLRGLYFCGQHWLHSLGSGLLYGVGETARHVTSHLLAARNSPRLTLLGGSHAG